MFLRSIKIILIVLAVVLGGASIYILKARHSTNARLNRVYDISNQTFQIISDSAILAEGERLVKSKGCADCHGVGMGGQLWMDEPSIGKLFASNLTPGKGGVGRYYEDSDWILAIRHGVRKDMKSLKFMPSYEYAMLSKQDLNAIIAYLKQLSPIDNELPDSEISLMGSVLTDLGKLPTVPAEMIDHSAQLVESVKVEVSIEYGKYMSISCIGCHRSNLKGGESVVPGHPTVPDITSSGNPGKWTDRQFLDMIRSGKTPEGKEINSMFMPWKSFANYSDTELLALFTYMKSL